MRPRRSALDDGGCVNLGIGLATRVPDHVPADVESMPHSENGILGTGRYPAEGEVAPASSTPGARGWRRPGSGSS
ncbi:hypothetical protein [Streptomyces sp. NPDC086519]|uniref:hypothetical protein n=1 Tax=Streptomyces sp. NPDC086519 TaxID=3154863 RepID=UPI00344AC584